MKETRADRERHEAGNKKWFRGEKKTKFSFSKLIQIKHNFKIENNFS